MINNDNDHNDNDCAIGTPPIESRAADENSYESTTAARFGPGLTVEVKTEPSVERKAETKERRTPINGSGNNYHLSLISLQLREHSNVQRVGGRN